MDSWPQLEAKLIEYGEVVAPTWPVISECLRVLEEDHQHEVAYPED